MSNNKVNLDGLADARARRLTARTRRSSVSLGYSKFVRIMRLVLPLAAMVVVAVLFIRSGMNEKLAIFVEDDSSGMHSEQDIVKNELLNPTFESMDKKQQSYKITADRAVQGEKNKDLIMLERPVGSMSMNNGVVIKVRADAGAYRQDTERFFLRGGVHVEHSGGYALKTQEAHIDLGKDFAWSDFDVEAVGPDISIDAKGVRANGETGEVIFTGPAKLVLGGK